MQLIFNILQSIKIECKKKMSTTQKSSKVSEFVDFIPAELRESKTWLVIYYVKNPFTDKLEMVRHRVKPLKSITERRKLGKQIAANINKKLYTGWNKFIDESKTKSFTKVTTVFETYIKQTEQQVKKQVIRKDTLRAYKSYISNLKNYLIDNQKEQMFVNDWKEELIRTFLDEIFFERDNSARTRNNYLRFIKSFSLWLMRKKYINTDPTINIEKLKETTKKRVIIPKKDRDIIFNYLKKENYGYFVLCLTALHTLIRRTEFTKILVSDVYMKNGIINIREEVSKNGKEQAVTISKELSFILAKHISNANNSDFLFSENKYKPGNIQIQPKKISDEWAKIRKKLKLNNRYQWYSLKDTGITNYLQLGLPLIDVKNQARHHSIKQTETYTPKNIIKSIENIKNANLNF